MIGGNLHDHLMSKGISASVMNKIFIRGSKITRKVATDSVGVANHLVLNA